MIDDRKNDVIIGEGNLAGKGVYAARDFMKGEVVVWYRLIELTDDEFRKLSESEKMFTHVRDGKIFLYSEPERYVNHADDPNTVQDFEVGCDVAIRDISAGEMITCDATKEDF